MDESIEIRIEVDPARSYGDLKGELVSSFEARLINIVLQRHSGNLSAAAKALKMDRKHLCDLARKHGLRKNPAEK